MHLWKHMFQTIMSDVEYDLLEEYVLVTFEGENTFDLVHKTWFAHGSCSRVYYPSLLIVDKALKYATPSKPSWPLYKCSVITSRASYESAIALRSRYERRGVTDTTDTEQQPPRKRPASEQLQEICETSSRKIRCNYHHLVINQKEINRTAFFCL